ncbi:MAG: acyltransferase [Sinobacteraceae bacterium]|nr:acyltransferase [Nevskiaceae bacterium]
MSASRIPHLPAEVPQVRSRWRRWLGLSGLALAGWRVEGNLPNLRKFVLIVAPHTSNWDFVVGFLAYLGLRLHSSWFVKHTALRWPWAALGRHFGAVAIDRAHAGNVVGASVAAMNSAERMVITLAPEGTRKKVAQWKHGYYRIAVEAGVPIVTAALDYSRRRVVFGDAMTPSGDYERDWPLLRAAFDARMARHPDQF